MHIKETALLSLCTYVQAQASAARNKMILPHTLYFQPLSQRFDLSNGLYSDHQATLHIYFLCQYDAEQCYPPFGQ